MTEAETTIDATLLENQTMSQTRLEAANADIADTRQNQHDLWLAKVLPSTILHPSSNRVKGGKGYLSIDNRATGGTLQEMPTMTCAHCNRIVVSNPARTRARGHCGRCHAYICDDTVCNSGCSPTLQQLELAMDHPELGDQVFNRQRNQALFGKQIY